MQWLWNNCSASGKPQGNQRDLTAEVLNFDRGMPVAFLDQLFVLVYTYFTTCYAGICRPRLTS
jgi:hypothetical protein